MDLRSHDITDALIVGAGPAGLAAALTLARLHHTAIVLDSGRYRNEDSVHMNMVLGWDGKEATEFRESTRQNILDRYDTIRFYDVGVDILRRREADGLFEAVDIQGHTHVGRKVVLATGSKDVFPPIEGFAECWAKGVYHCLICSMTSSKQPSAGVLVHGDVSEAHHLLILARMALQYAPIVTIYTNEHAAIHSALESTLAQATSQPTTSKCNAEPKILLDPRPVSHLALLPPPPPPQPSSTSPSTPPYPVELTFADGSSTTEGFVAHRTRAAPRNRLAQMLGVELAPSGEAVVGWKARQTSVRGVFAAGDAASMMKNVPAAQLDGTCAAWGLAMQLEAEMMGHEDVDFGDR